MDAFVPWFLPREFPYQPDPVLGKRGVIPERVIHGQSDEPPEQQTVVDLSNQLALIRACTALLAHLLPERKRTVETGALVTTLGRRMPTGANAGHRPEAGTRSYGTRGRKGPDCRHSLNSGTAVSGCWVQ